MLKWRVEHLPGLGHLFDRPAHHRVLVQQADQWLRQPAGTSGRGVHLQ
jgi:hypothetical protein